MIRKLTRVTKDVYQRPNDDCQEAQVTLQDASDEEASIRLRKSSLRFKRRQFTFVVTAFVVGSVLILMQSPIRNDLLAPGPLTSNHAQILAGEGSNRCASCHDAGKQSITKWLQTAFQPGRNVQACQSDLCMKCHNNSMDEQWATKPHNVNPTELKRITENYKSVSFKLRLTAPIGHNGDIECSTCHREHHGHSDLSRMTDQQCQTCHAEQFHRFETDHPEFVSWPLGRRQRIAFDHASHGYKHFPEQNEKFDCAKCHIDDQFQNVKQLADFEQACAKCHQKNIENSNEAGLQLVSLPLLDLDSIQGHGLTIGQWPENATGDFDGDIPELMRLLLFKDDTARSILEKRGPEFAFADLDPDDPTDVADAVKLAWSVKGLIYDLAVNGPEELRRRVEFGLQRSITDRDYLVLVEGLNSNTFADAANSWLPDLAEEIQQRRGANKNRSFAEQLHSQPLLRYFSNDDPELLAENPIAKLMGISNDSPDGPAHRPEQRSKHDSTVAANQEQSLRPTIALGTRPPFANETDSNAIGNLTGGIADSQLLAKNPLANPREYSEQNSQSEFPNANLDSATKPPDRSDLDSELVRKTIQKPGSVRPSQPDSESSNVELFIGTVSTDGWFRNDKLFQISYRPRGHADAHVATWMDLVAGTANADTNTATAAFFHKMTSDASIGACNNCHTIDSRPDDSFSVNWGPDYRNPLVRSFTRFSHGPHITQPLLKDCTSCHAMDKQLTNAHTFEHYDHSDVVSNFSPIKKANCTSCHFEGGTDNSCTQCHNYHVGSRVLLGQ